MDSGHGRAAGGGLGQAEGFVATLGIMDAGEAILRLVPTPTRVERLGGWAELGGGDGVRCVRIGRGADERSVAGQAYRLEVLNPGEDGVLFELTVASEAGKRYGLATARQMMNQAKRWGNRLPRVRVVDEPSFAVRGVMLDVSRDRIPTMQELFAIVDSLADLKVNHLQLYTEHTFAYVGHEAAWNGWSPMTPDEVRRLDVYCRERGVELAANQNCFGHLAHWLKLPQYQHLAETHGDWMFDVWKRSGPFSLCPIDPKSIEFVDGLLEQLLPCFESGLCNIGCDETYDVGFGRSKGVVESSGGGTKGRGAVYAEFVSKVCERVRKRGKRPMFWADIALHDASALDLLPRDLIALAWGYEPDSAFDAWAEAVRSRGRELWVCPGTSSWRSITGRTSERYVNLARAAEAGHEHGAVGYLVCDWGDTGHHQQWPIAMMGIAHGAHAGWNHERAAELDSRAVALQVFGDEGMELGPWLDELGDADLELRRTCGRLSRPELEVGKPHVLRNQSAVFNDMHNHGLNDLREVGEVSAWKRVFDRVMELASRKPTGLSSLIADEIEQTLRLARFAAGRAFMRRREGGVSVGELAAMRADLSEIMREHERLWMIRSRAGGLGHSMGFYEKVMVGLGGGGA